MLPNGLISSLLALAVLAAGLICPCNGATRRPSAPAEAQTNRTCCHADSPQPAQHHDDNAPGHKPNCPHCSAQPTSDRAAKSADLHLFDFQAISFAPAVATLVMHQGAANSRPAPAIHATAAPLNILLCTLLI